VRKNVSVTNIFRPEKDDDPFDNSPSLNSSRQDRINQIKVWYKTTPSFRIDYQGFLPDSKFEI